jgi:hypothetical protein
MVRCNSDVHEEKVRLSTDVYRDIDTGEQLLGEGGHSLRKDTRIFLQTGGSQSRKHVIWQARNSKATHLLHNNTSRHLPCTPCKSYCPSGAEAADYMIKLSMSWYPKTLGRNFRRTHKPLEAEAEADSQADHYSRPDTTAEAAEGSNLDQAVALRTNTLINNTEAITTSREGRTTLRGIILLLLRMLTVVIFVGHEDG